MVIEQIFISPGHNYFGHAGRPADDFPLLEVDRVECVAGSGLRGDRFFDYKDDYKGQITFFSREIFNDLREAFPSAEEKSPGVLRRNVMVSGVDLNSLIGQEFMLQGIRLFGAAHCKPCYWMNQAFAPGAEEWLRGKGGLRARILTSGWLEIGVPELAHAAQK